MIYLDWNSTTPPSEAVRDAMRVAATESWANPSSLHAAGRAARAVLDRTRERVALSVGRDPRDVVFTSGGTEANNLALRGVAPASLSDLLLVTSRAEHPSVTATAEALAQGGARVEWLSLGAGAHVRLEGLGALLEAAPQRVRVVCVQAVNHETGAIQAVAEAARVAHATGALLIVDAVQALGRVPRELLEPADVLVVSSHKVRGPKGVGAVVARGGLVLSPLHHGGGQERGVRPGTLDPVAIAGFGAALAELEQLEEGFARVEALRDRLEQAVTALGGVSNRTSPSAPHVVNASFQGRRSDELCAALDLEGVAASSGAACSAGTAAPSAVVATVSGEQRARSALRLSLGPTSTESEVDTAIILLNKVISRSA